MTAAGQEFVWTRFLGHPDGRGGRKPAPVAGKYYGTRRVGPFFLGEDTLLTKDDHEFVKGIYNRKDDENPVFIAVSGPGGKPLEPGRAKKDLKTIREAAEKSAKAGKRSKAAKSRKVTTKPKGAKSNGLRLDQAVSQTAPAEQTTPTTEQPKETE